MRKLYGKVDGYKSYIIAGATIVYAVSGGFLGFITWQHAGELIIAAFGLGALKNAISKVE